MPATKKTDINLDGSRAVPLQKNWKIHGEILLSQLGGTRQTRTVMIQNKISTVHKNVEKSERSKRKDGKKIRDREIEGLLYYKAVLKMNKEGPIHEYPVASIWDRVNEKAGGYEDNEVVLDRIDQNVNDSVSFKLQRRNDQNCVEIQYACTNKGLAKSEASSKSNPISSNPTERGKKYRKQFCLCESRDVDGICLFCAECTLCFLKETKVLTTCQQCNRPCHFDCRNGEKCPLCSKVGKKVSFGNNKSIIAFPYDYGDDQTMLDLIDQLANDGVSFQLQVKKEVDFVELPYASSQESGHTKAETSPNFNTRDIGETSSNYDVPDTGLDVSDVSPKVNNLQTGRRMFPDKLDVNKCKNWENTPKHASLRASKSYDIHQVVVDLTHDEDEDGRDINKNRNCTEEKITGVFMFGSVPSKIQIENRPSYSRSPLND